MSLVSFDQPVETQAPAPPTTMPLATREPQPLVERTFYQDGDAEGEITREDTRIPRINVVAKVGELSNQFDPGSIVLNKETVLAKKEAALIVTPVKIRKSYQEDTAFEDGIGKTAKTLAEVQALGGQIDDREGPNYWISVADIIFLVEKPEGAGADVEALFYEEIGGKFYLLAAYTARNSAYTAVAKPIFQRKLQTGSIQGMTYQLTSKLRAWEGNTWFCPNLRPAGKPAAEIGEYLTNLSF